MKILTKIKAFTLSEMIVVLLLTTILVSMAFAVLRLVEHQMAAIGGNYKWNTELNLLKQSLWIDFNRHDRIWYDASTEQLVFNNGLGEVVYEFQEGFIVKKLDTFHLKIEKKRFFFNGSASTNGEIDAIDIMLSKEQGNKQLFVFKKNAATTHINN
jgi:hypothetical protein